MYNCIIIEDDYVSALRIKIIVEEIGYEVADIILNLQELKDFKKIKTADIILSDVKLGEDLFAYDILKNKKGLPPIIFFSSYTDHRFYSESKSVNPYIYLTKPVNAISLRSAIEGAMRDKSMVHKKDLKVVSGSVFVRSKGKLENISPIDILFVESEGNYCYIYTKNKKVVIRSSLKGVLVTMNHEELHQVNRNFLINLSHVSNIDLRNGTVSVRGKKILIGRGFRKDFIANIKNKNMV